MLEAGSFNAVLAERIEVTLDEQLRDIAEPQGNVRLIIGHKCRLARPSLTMTVPYDLGAEADYVRCSRRGCNRLEDGGQLRPTDRWVSRECSVQSSSPAAPRRRAETCSTLVRAIGQLGRARPGRAPCRRSNTLRPAPRPQAPAPGPATVSPIRHCHRSGF